MRLRFAARVDGPCMRCLENAAPTFEVDSYEVHQPGGGEELISPYIDDDELDVEALGARRAGARAAGPDHLPRRTAPGLCAECGANLNEDPSHAHEREPSPRWAKLSELKFD